MINSQSVVLMYSVRFVCNEVDGDDMDISPGVSACEESRLTTSMSSDQQSSDPYIALGSLTEDSTSNSTFLNTLAKLQQALQQVTADKLSSGSSPKSVPSSVLNLLATLPSLICKLKTAGEPRTAALCQSQPVDQQQITLQGQSHFQSVFMCKCAVLNAEDLAGGNDYTLQLHSC